MKKILFLAPFFAPNIGGAETFAKDLLIELEKRHEVTLITSNFSGTWAGVGIGNINKILPQMLKKSILKAKKHDIVFCNGLISAIIGLILHYFWRKRSMCVLLALYDFKGKSAIFRFLARKILLAQEIIFVEGMNGRQDLLDIKIPEKKIRIFYHWCDQSLFKPIERENKFIKVLFVGRSIPEKGKHIIEQVKRMMKGQLIEFNFIENIDYNELPKWYQYADVLIVPSLYSEGYVRVIVEAASCKCAIITSNMGSLPEQVKDFGLSVTNIPFYYEQILKHWITNKKDLIYYQEKAYQYAKKNFSNRNAEVILNEI